MAVKKLCKVCNTPKSIYDFYEGRRVCKVCYMQSKSMIPAKRKYAVKQMRRLNPDDVLDYCLIDQIAVVKVKGKTKTSDRLIICHLSWVV